MKFRQFYLLICLSLVLINLFAVYTDVTWLAKLCELLLFIPLLAGFYKKLNFKNINVTGFIALSVISGCLLFFSEHTGVYLVAILFRMSSYAFLSREALKYTKREAANKFMLSFFFLLIGVNTYFVFRHLQELEIYMGGIVEFAVYSAYYINLLVLAIVALIYYLNSYSRKSVFFIILVMSLVISDILRDMAVFYLSDTSVLLMKNILSMGGVILSFQFFATKEKKLRLINLV